MLLHSARAWNAKAGIFYSSSRILWREKKKQYSGRDMQQIRTYLEKGNLRAGSADKICEFYP